jgi:glycosyltransferase involved in cell wall biosynthesis
MKNGRVPVMFPVNQLGVGGAERQLAELVKGMDKNRFEPIVVSLYPGGALEPEVKAMPGVELISLRRRGRFDFLILFKIYRLLRQRRVKIIQPFLTPASFFGMAPSFMNRRLVKIITERCGVRVNPRLGSSLYRKAEDFLTRYADWVVPNSQSGEDYVIKRGISPAKVKVIYNGINLERLKPNPDVVARIRQQVKLPPGGKIIGITASLTPAKDHATFLKAAKAVSAIVPQTRFVMLGDGPLRPDLERMSRELGIDSVVTFFGNQRDVGSYISSYDIACLTSFDHEGCSNATLEAMALGKPVVVTDIGGNREVVEHGITGLLVPPKNPEALANNIITYLKQPELAQRIGQQAKQKVLTQFSIPRMVQEYQDLFETALKQQETRRKKS